MPDNFSSAVNHEAYQKGDIYHTRKLNDGQEYRIIKVFYEPEQLSQTLAALDSRRTFIPVGGISGTRMVCERINRPDHRAHTQVRPYNPLQQAYVIPGGCGLCLPR